VTATASPERTGPDLPDAASRSSRRGDRTFEAIVRIAALTILVALVAVFIFLAVEGWVGLTADPATYAPFTSFITYITPLVVSTLLSSAIALIVAVPFAIAVALFVSHYAPRRLASALAYLIDLLAAVPSVVFGLWGGRYLAAYLQPLHVWLHDHFGFLPFFGPGPPSPNGRSLFTAGIVLAIMILPIITAISREVFVQTPRLHEEAALALGATRWEMIRYAVFPYARSGMVSGVMLGLGRALGETMAVAMVLATTPNTTLNVIGVASPPTIAANIALNYKESTPTRQSLLIATGLVLFVVTFLVNFAARWIAGRSARRLNR
jgi:phosphate transport system permease protein